MAGSFWVARLSWEEAGKAWPAALPALAPAIAMSSGLWLPEDVERKVTEPGDWCLWIICEGATLWGALVTRPVIFPREVVLEVVFAGGERMDEYLDLILGELDKYATSLGIRRIRAYGRKGWARRGYRMLGAIVERQVEP